MKTFLFLFLCTQEFTCIFFTHNINYKYFRLVIFLWVFLKFYSERFVINFEHLNYWPMDKLNHVYTILFDTANNAMEVITNCLPDNKPKHWKYKSTWPQSGVPPHFWLSTVISTMDLRTLCQWTKAQALRRVKNNEIKNNTTRREFVWK